MIEDNVMGVYLFAEKKFYYIHYGPGMTGAAALSRTTSALIAQGKIKAPASAEDLSLAEPYKIVSIREAKANKYEMHPMFVSPMAKKYYDTKEGGEGSGGSASVPKFMKKKEKPIESTS